MPQNPPPGFTSEPQPAPAPMLESEARDVSMWLHYGAAIAAIVSGGVLGFLVPLVMWLIYRDRSALVDWHGKQNLNLQLTAIVVGVGAVVLGFITLGIGFFLTLPLWGAYWIYLLVISFIAGTAAQRGEYYSIKLTIPFVR